MSRRKEMYRRCRRDAAFVGELQGQQREDDRHDRLAGDLGLAAQAERALLADLDEVVEEADHPEPGEQEQDQQGGRGRARSR